MDGDDANPRQGNHGCPQREEPSGYPARRCAGSRGFSPDLRRVADLQPALKLVSSALPRLLVGSPAMSAVRRAEPRAKASCSVAKITQALRLPDDLQLLGKVSILSPVGPDPTCPSPLVVKP